MKRLKYRFFLLLANDHVFMCRQGKNMENLPILYRKLGVPQRADGVMGKTICLLIRYTKAAQILEIDIYFVLTTRQIKWQIEKCDVIQFLCYCAQLYSARGRHPIDNIALFCIRIHCLANSIRLISKFTANIF